MSCQQSDSPSTSERNNPWVSADSVLLQAIETSFRATGDEDLQAIDPEGQISPLPHAHAKAEQWHVLLPMQNKTGKLLGVEKQISRIRLKPMEDDLGDSGWAFNDVMMVQHTVSRELTAVNTESQQVSYDLQRAANDLAGTDDRGRIWVGGHRLEFNSLSACEHTASLSSGLINAVTLGLHECPEVSNAPGLTSLTYRVQAQLEFDGRYSGNGWLIHSWGRLPTAGGAVVFDRAWLSMEGVGDVQLVRRKRRAGIGPVRTTASIRNTEDAVRALRSDVAVVLQDGRGQTVDAGILPHTWTLQIEDLSLDVTLSAIIADSRNQDVVGLPWRRLVRVTGTHQGVGFIEHNPVPMLISKE